MHKKKFAKKVIKISDANEFLIVLEEYKALRAEILQAMVNCNVILTFSLAVLGTIVSAAGVVYKNSAFLSFLLIGFIVPIFSTFASFFWLFEISSIVKITSYIKLQIEQKIVCSKDDSDLNATANEQRLLLSWETWLQDNHNSHFLSEKVNLVFVFSSFFNFLSFFYVVLALSNPSTVNRLPEFTKVVMPISVFNLTIYVTHLFFLILNGFLVCYLWQKIRWIRNLMAEVHRRPS